MNDDELQFGELETTQPETALRPDRNKHYAVAALGEPRTGELPIFVDLDVMRDIEQHAVSDTTVELGGVLLGAACHDADRGSRHRRVPETARPRCAAGRTGRRVVAVGGGGGRARRPGVDRGAQGAQG